MTLKEKFQQEPVVVYQESFILTNQSAEQLIVIADEFAIGFAEWVNEEYIHYHGDGEYYDHVENRWYKLEELLEIYKKEKGL